VGVWVPWPNRLWAPTRDTAPVSGRQEYLENLLNSYL